VRRSLLALTGGLAFVLLSLLAWQAPALHFTLSWGLCLLLGFGLLGAGAFSLFFLVPRPGPSLAARLLLIVGPAIGCAAIGLALILMVTSPNSGATIYLFAVGIVAFQAAAVGAIFVGVSRRKNPA
jgi:hypothetical protein